MWLSRAIEPALELDREVNDVTTRHQVMLTADNYEFKVDPARDSANGRDCFVLDLKPRRKSPYLLNGKAWVDARTYLLVRIRGTQSSRLLKNSVSRVNFLFWCRCSGFILWPLPLVPCERAL